MAKILIVEDNVDNLDMISRRLSKRGYEIVSAINGQLGVDAAYQHKPDLILMDLDLPVMDGYEATRQIKASLATGHIPVVALTANAMAGDAEIGLAAGCDAYCTKPVDLPELLAIITSLLTRAG